ncbi:hypothetical protein NDU88_000686 [Pleurodeles waltl]|uniref:Uncharacterized protein n=1 Tax=Pleurodeles waltl TaxID=8319 RepID=A0AAV7R4Y3_PLEWA|nr:hypothetical protein NDU88_000686 [Pleurodeles waltl]
MRPHSRRGHLEIPAGSRPQHRSRITTTGAIVAENRRPMRQNGCGFSAFVGRIGSSVAPLILLLDEVWKPLPQVIYCSVAVASGLITYCLHETLNMRLPETVKDIENTRSKSTSPTMEPEEVIRMQKF